MNFNAYRYHTHPETLYGWGKQMVETRVYEETASTKWMVNGRLHREDGPADVYVTLNDGYVEEWWFNGRYYRDGGPTITHNQRHNYQEQWSTDSPEFDPLTQPISIRITKTQWKQVWKQSMQASVEFTWFWRNGKWESFIHPSPAEVKEDGYDYDIVSKRHKPFVEPLIMKLFDA